MIKPVLAGISSKFICTTHEISTVFERSWLAPFIHSFIYFHRSIHKDVENSYPEKKNSTNVHIVKQQYTIS
jgi:hypothetical protein